MNKYQEAFNHIVDYGVEVEYFNKQANKPEEESTIMIVSKALDKLDKAKMISYKNHPIIKILEELGCVGENEWGFVYQGRNYVVQVGWVRLWDNTRKQYDVELFERIISRYYSGRSLNFIKPVAEKKFYWEFMCDGSMLSGGYLWFISEDRWTISDMPPDSIYKAEYQITKREFEERVYCDLWKYFEKIEIKED